MNARPADGSRPVVLVTGASSGIGAVTATRLAQAGWYPLLSGTDPARLADIARQTGGVALPGDLLQADGIQELARRALAVSGRVDAVIANAGIGWRGPFTGMPLDVLDRMIALNLTVPLSLARLLLPAMVERGSGCLVLTGSIVGRLGVREEAAYAATKAALGIFAESLRYELQGTGVLVRLVLPGAVDTPYFARRGTPYHRDRPRPVPPERVADAVLALLTGRREESVVPGWLRVPQWLHGASPALFRRMAGRFD